MKVRKSVTIEHDELIVAIREYMEKYYPCIGELERLCVETQNNQAFALAVYTDTLDKLDDTEKAKKAC
jgi:hypothetical protein